MIKGMDYVIFFLFASMAMISIPWVYFLFPETKRIPLENMEELFDYPASKAHLLVFNDWKRDVLQNDTHARSLTSHDKLKQILEHVGAKLNI